MGKSIMETKDQEYDSKNETSQAKSDLSSQGAYYETPPKNHFRASKP